jgi:hypothetical protein
MDKAISKVQGRLVLPRARGNALMHIFLTFASEQKSIAEKVASSLRSRGFNVFVDNDDLPPGHGHPERVENAIKASDYFVLLVSPQSLHQASDSHTALEFARHKWRNQHGHILPVMVAPTEMAELPEFLRAATVLEPKDEVATEVASYVMQAERAARRNIIAWFAAGGLLSGIFGTYLAELPGSRLLDSVGGFNFYPGLYFGLVLCALFVKRLGAPLARLAIVLLVVQLSWQAAVRIAIVVSDIIETRNIRLAQTDTTARQPESSEPRSETSSTSASDGSRGIIAYDLIIPGLIAGLIGAFGTWLAATVTVPRLRCLVSGSLTTVVGGVAGPLLAVNLPLLYVAWQSAVAASLAYRMTIDRA